MPAWIAQARFLVLLEEEVAASSFQELWYGVVQFVPNLVVAIIILAIGWVIGTVIGRAIAQIFRSIRVDEALKKTGAEEALERGGMHLNSGAFVGGLVRWFIIVVFLIGAFEVLGLQQVNLFLQEVVLSYLPRVIIAALVLLAAGVLGDVMEKVVLAGARAAHFRWAALSGTVARWAIWIFAILVALAHLGIAAGFVQTIFTGVVIALSLALGLSFGLGGQEAAARFLDKVRSDISDKR